MCIRDSSDSKTQILFSQYEISFGKWLPTDYIDTLIHLILHSEAYVRIFNNLNSLKKGLLLIKVNVYVLYENENDVCRSKLGKECLHFERYI